MASAYDALHEAQSVIPRVSVSDYMPDSSVLPRMGSCLDGCAIEEEGKGIWSFTNFSFPMEFAKHCGVAQ